MALKYRKVRALNPSFDPKAVVLVCCEPCARGARSSNPKGDPERPAVSRRVRALANRLARGETR